MNKSYGIKAEWQDNMWIATSEDVIGLAVEAHTLEELLELLKIIIPELLEANDHLKPQKNLPVVLSTPIQISNGLRVEGLY